MKIYISGLYGGTNPQPGVGIARSLRAAYPTATLIGVEYSNRCSGIHWQDFDEIWLQRPWNELNLAAHAESIKAILESGGIWISGIDLEIIWLAEVFLKGHPNLLAPLKSALERTAKPAVSAREKLPVKIPAYVSTEISDWDLHAFSRRHDWKIWLKGPYYEALKVKNWADLENKRWKLKCAWSTERLFLQAHVTGYEESVALAACKGELLRAVYMHKRDLTEMNKTWAGDVSEVPPALLDPLREIIREINWTGGAELEMVRDADDQLWLLEWNPRFPAWIHGATIAGHNLPALLIESATGSKAQPATQFCSEFTRVVLEIPVRREFPLPPLPEPFAGKIGHSLKHPSGLLEFANRLHAFAGGESEAASQTKAPLIPEIFLADLTNINFDQTITPSWVFLERTAATLFGQAARLTASLNNGIQIKNAYSVKTNPDARLIQCAFENDFLVEAISPLEINKALEIGFRSDQVILNGPGKWWRKEYLPESRLYAVFCDSIADLRRVAAAIDKGSLKTRIAGVRLRMPNIESRFGIPIDTPDALENLIEAVKILPRENRFGVHFHMASSSVGVRQWWHLFESMLRWCGSIEALTGRLIEALDIGGGWFPDDWQDSSNERLARALESVREFLPHVKEIVSEPGKALAQPSMALAMRILEIQESGNEVVVDGSIAELPMYFLHPHRILYMNRHSGKWTALKRGKTKLLGRLCMEHDIVASGVELPGRAEAGDLLIFFDAGAYDRSMSYVFGCG